MVTGGHRCRLLLILDGLAVFTLSQYNPRSLLFSQVERTKSTPFMAPQRTSQQPWDPASYPSTHQHRLDSEEDEDTKAPYDDLIDQYAIPFHPNPSHKAYNVNSAAFAMPDPSLSDPYLSQKTTRTSDGFGKDSEGASSDAHGWAYPPSATKEEEKPKVSLWEMVRELRSVPGRSLT